MTRTSTSEKDNVSRRGARVFTAVGVLVFAVFIYLIGFSHLFGVVYSRADDLFASTSPTSAVPVIPPLDTAAYDAKMLFLSHINIASTTTSLPVPAASSTATTTLPKLTLITHANATTTVSVPGKLWPTPTVYPNPGGLLPTNRIVAYYGNFYSKGMGVLGQYPEDVMISKLKAAVAQWQAADPSTPVIPAIDYIDVTAQGSPGKDGKYRLRMPDDQIDKAITIANKVNGIVILDIQVGLSNLQTELPLLDTYLKMPNVHLAIDPEFAMHNGVKPGKVIGTMSASDINFAANYLAKLVRDNNLPPKILIVHRFTEEMVTGYKQIKPLPEVQIVMDMDGWGFGAKKINTYNSVVQPEPVQFTGFKLFYKNDLLPPSTAMLTPAQILKLTPSPSFIQYQ